MILKSHIYNMQEPPKRPIKECGDKKGERKNKK
jgi:hypothetical protein